MQIYRTKEENYLFKGRLMYASLDSDVELIATYKVNLANFGHIEVQNESYFRYRELVEI